jgi:DNA-binding MarR family transcriptional regulator
MSGRYNTLTPAEFQRLQEFYVRDLQADPEITIAQYKVAMFFHVHADKETAEIRGRRISAITKETGVSDSTAKRAIKYHVDRQRLEVERRPGAPSTYRIQNLDPGQSCDLPPKLSTEVKAMTPTQVKAMTPNPGHTVTSLISPSLSPSLSASLSPSLSPPERSAFCLEGNASPSQEREEAGRGSEAESEEEKSPQALGPPPLGEQSEPVSKPDDVPRPKLSMEEMRERFNMPDLGRSERRRSISVGSMVAPSEWRKIQ